MSCSRGSSMSNSGRSRWKLAEQSMIQVRINLVQHTQCSNTASMTQQQESLIRAKPGHRMHLALEKLKLTFSSRPPPRRTILKDLENKCIIAMKQHRGVHKDMLHQPQNTISLRDTRWSSNVNLLSNFMPRMSRLGLHQMEITDKTKSPWGGFTVLDHLSTKVLVL